MKNLHKLLIGIVLGLGTSLYLTSKAPPLLRGNNPGIGVLTLLGGAASLTAPLGWGVILLNRASTNREIFMERMPGESPFGIDFMALPPEIFSRRIEEELAVRGAGCSPCTNLPALLR